MLPFSKRSVAAAPLPATSLRIVAWQRGSVDLDVRVNGSGAGHRGTGLDQAVCVKRCPVAPVSEIKPPVSWMFPPSWKLRPWATRVPLAVTAKFPVAVVPAEKTAVFAVPGSAEERACATGSVGIPEGVGSIPGAGRGGGTGAGDCSVDVPEGISSLDLLEGDGGDEGEGERGGFFVFHGKGISGRARSYV